MNDNKVTLAALKDGMKMPIVVTPTQNSLNPTRWAQDNQSHINTLLAKHACILFRGFDLTTPADFEQFVAAICPQLYGNYGDLPKIDGQDSIYESTPYPEDMKILFHNESSHMSAWPSKQWFFCEQPAPVGGATPIVDCTELYQLLPAAIRDEFQRKGLSYVRTYHKRLDVSWQHAFKTDSLDEVKKRCETEGVALKLLDHGVVQTRSESPAVIKHPITGELSFFNQIQLHHPAYLVPDIREMLVELVGEALLPRNVFFGDGSVIPQSTLDIVDAAYEQCAVRFDWQKGDVVMLDNMLVAHGRDEFEGARRIAVAMGDMFNARDLAKS